ncbi:VQ motif-containing protein 8, chloroplastic [Senna tora]|uniref:VQ motif-containing protein 8, chloroplastic n=1 Tax=Senna tora TaxID=362788 RepID=A0A834WLL0_9FABA|nr:VQ motif-containing protein 8, chloroplastic [Senna tora]
MKPRPESSINGPRPSPLNIMNADSRPIKKQPHGVVSVAAVRKPIIIYTHSPKVIHTKAQDFMALVQSLTGMPPPRHPHRQPSRNDAVLSNIKEENSNSTTTTTTTGGGGGSVEDGGNEITSLALGKGSVYKYNSSDSSSPFGFLGSLISPSALEFIRDLPEY